MSGKETQIITIIVAASAIVLTVVAGIISPLPTRSTRASDFSVPSDPNIYNRQTEGNRPSVYESARDSESTQGSYQTASSRGGKRKTKRKSTKR